MVFDKKFFSKLCEIAVMILTALGGYLGAQAQTNHWF